MEAAQSTDPFMSYWQLVKKGMVFKPESKVKCIVLHPNLNKITLHVTPDSQVQSLMEEIASRYHHEVDSFDLILQKNKMILTDKMSGSLEELGFEVEPDSRNTLVLTMRNKTSTRINSSSSCSVVGKELCAVTADCQIAPPPLPPIISQTHSPPHFTYNSIIKHDTAYVGLVNQAMTCYLNSLIQALYMTPEFRNALYMWKPDSSDKRSLLPLELQKLFLNLQTSKRNAVETTELTRSFGWETSDVWQQHDIQELCRVMFDALEQVLKNTEHADLIDRLYQGKMIDYVKCLECGREKTRDDTFLDIPLPLRPFGSTVAYGSVEEAMKAFVQPETLDGNNQYHCENCQKKCDAHKGLKFSKFPYLLTLHLKRFDFDYQTMHRIKLNDKVVFPDTLDLNSFISHDKDKDREEGLGDEELGGAGSRCNDDSSTTDSGSALDDDNSCCPVGAQGAAALAAAASATPTASVSDNNCYQQSNDNEDDEGIDVSGGQNDNNEKNRQHGQQKRPYVYELFSIMIHSGSASGGHYYAYIKDFANGLWFCFNDQNVTRITQEDITKTYGGGLAGRQYYSAAYSSSTNAYMLMYRKIDKDRNCDAITVDNFPPHIKELYRKMQEKEENDRRLKEKESEVCRLKIHCIHPESKKDSKLIVRHDRTMEEVTELAWKQMDLENVVPLEQCRLVSYDPIQEVIEESYEGHEGETISSILAQRKHVNRPDFLLEVRQENVKFEQYQLGDVSLQAQVVNLDSGEIDSPILVRGDSLQTIDELKENLVRTLHLSSPASKITIAMETFTGGLMSIKETEVKCSKLLSDFNSQIIYVCDGHCDEDPEKQFNHSKMLRIIQQYMNSIFIHVFLPDTDPEILERLAIPPLNSVEHNSTSVSTDKSNDTLAENDKVVNNVSDSSSSPRGGLSLPLSSAATNYTTSPSSNTAAVLPTIDAEDAGAGGGDQSTSEDSSLTDSDRTLIGDDPEEYPLYNSNDLTTDKLIQLGGNDSEDYKISTPEATPNQESTSAKGDGDKWFEANGENASGNSEESKPTGSQYNYFRAQPYSKVLKPNQKILKVHVDKRMTVGKLKQCLESYVGVSSKYFKIYLTSGNQDVECTRLKDTLSTFKDLDKVEIKLERVLRGGEHTVKLFHLILDSSQPFKLLCDWIIVKGQTVGKTKQEILNELSKKFNIKIPYNKCRLRKRNWRSPTKVCLDDQIWEEDIILTPNPELLLQELPETEIVTSPSQLLLFLRRWYPSKLQLSSLHEIALDDRSVQGLKSKISDVSGIPVEFVEFVKSTAGFPSDVSVLSVQDMEWNRHAESIDNWPLNIDDGNVLFYRDNREQVKTLTSEERKELTNKENARLGSPCHISPRKERPLRIYVDGSRSSNININTNTNTSSDADCSV